MSCKILVLVKQVPDTAHISGDVMKPDGTVNRSKLPAVFNPDDRVALELALRMKDRYDAGVVALTMGPPKASEMLRECLYMGADDVVLVTDRRFAGADTQATSYVLAAAVEKLGPFDIVFAGRQAIDGDTAQVGPQTAQKVGFPQITCAQEVVEYGDGRIVVRRRIDGGYEVLRSVTPVLITVFGEAATPRPFRARRLLSRRNARSLPELQKLATEERPVEQLVSEQSERHLYIRTLSAGDLGVDVDRCGLHGSPTKVKSVASVVLSATGHETFPPTPEGMSALLDRLMEDRVFG